MRSLSSCPSSNYLLPFDVNTSTIVELSELTENSINSNSTPMAISSTFENSDLLRCYSVIVERDTTTLGGLKGPICQRITTLQTYMNLNR